MKLEAVEPRHVSTAIRKIMDRNTPIIANRKLDVLKPFLNWCVEEKMIAGSPAAGMKKPAKAKSRDRVLGDDELKTLWSAFEEMGYPFGAMFQLLAIAGQRRNEVASMRWSDIDGDAWTIPAEMNKSGRVHIVYLSPLARRILGTLPRIVDTDFVFPSRAGGDRPVSGFSKAKCRADELSGISGWRVHDLRRTIVGGMARLGIAPHVADKVLNHSGGQVISGVMGVYNRYEYLEERQHALNAWGSYLERLIEDKTDEKVVAIDLLSNGVNRRAFAGCQ